MLVNNAKRGFTLIELLIVIAILGVLAVVVLVAINPVQQLARTRDAGRKSSVTQLGHAISAYYTARNGTYPTASATWMTDLVTAGELGSAVSAIACSAGTCLSACTSNPQASFCYAQLTVSTGAIVYTPLESDIEKSKCTSSDGYFVYNATQGKGGLVCVTTGTQPAASLSTNFNTVQ